MPAAFPIVRDTLDGTTASGEYEARLGRAEFGKEVHVYAPAYTQPEVDRLVSIADHIYFNSPEQIARFGPTVQRAQAIAIGIRVNPGYSNATLGGALYNPCARYSRFGTTKDELARLPSHRCLCPWALESLRWLVGLIRPRSPRVCSLSQTCGVNFGGGPLHQ
jgi:carboxynorspermidine decarboxylase